MNHTAIAGLETWLSQQIIGQADLVKKLLIAILADGHLLVEGAPGLAKTRAIKMMAEGVEGDFHRVQFTPDLLPGDITGTDVFRPQLGQIDYEVIGEITNTKRVVFSSNEKIVVDLPVDIIVDDAPEYDREFSLPKKRKTKNT